MRSPRRRSASPCGCSRRPPRSRPLSDAVAGEVRRELAHRGLERADAPGPAAAAGGSRGPARRTAARPRAPARRSRTPATGAPRRSPPSRRDPPGRPRSGSSRRSPDARAPCSRTDEARGHVLRDHEPGVEPAVAREERRLALRHGRVEHALGAPLGDGRRARPARSSACRARTRTGSPWKLPLDMTSPCSASTERVVGRGVDLDRDASARRRPSASRTAPCTCGVQRSE